MCFRGFKGYGMKRTLAFLLALITVFGLAACGSEGGEPVVIPNGDPIEIESEKKITISELQADNAAFVMSCMDDWIELYNDGESEARLNSYYLKKGDKTLLLDDRTIPAKGYIVIRLTDKSPFRLAKEGDSVTLFYRDKAVDQLSFDETIGTNSFGHEGVLPHPTPGYANDEEGYREYLAGLKAPELRINEVVSSNSKYAPVDGNFYDFVEIKNASDSPVDLSKYRLSDKRSELDRYRFPNRTLEPGGFFVVYCSGLEGEDHASFKIGSSGETIYLSSDEGIIDCVTVPGDLARDESYGRSGDKLVYMSNVTPGAENAPGFDTSLLAPAASVPTGAYAEPFRLTLSGEGTVYYTLDGTAPTENSRVYSEPISVSKIASVRTFCVKDGRQSPIASYFYTAGLDHAFPILNIAIKQSYLDGDKGVLNHVDPEYEHECYATLFEEGEVKFEIPCGFKLHGNDSKKGAKQNFQLRFRADYGVSKLNYKVFENRDFDVYNSLLLKGGSEDYQFCGFRDELCTSIVDGVTELSVQAYRPVILYLNGKYWGIYWLRERIDADFCANRLGVSSDSINLTKDYGFSLVKGSLKTFAETVEYCKTHDLRNKEDYDYVMRRVDAASLMDWYICRSYFADTDLANGRFYSSTEDDGRWHWCFFDLDWAMFNNSTESLAKTARNDGNHAIIVALLKNPEFKDKFLKRYASLMKSVLNEQTILKKIDEFVTLMQPEIEQDRAAYGFSVNSWNSAVERLRDFVRDGKRDTNVLIGIKSYFGLSDSEMMNYFGRTK